MKPARTRAGLLASMTLLALAACNSLPRHLRKQAEALPAQMDSVQAEVDRREASYAALTRTDDFSFFAPYAEREAWADRFARADRQIQEARDLYAAQVVPVLETNEEAQQALLSRLVARVRNTLQDARASSREPGERRAFLARVRTQAGAMVATADSAEAVLDSLMATLAPAADQMRTKYPRRIPAIDSIAAALGARAERADRALAVAHAELGRHVADKAADYAALGDAALLVPATLAALTRDVPAGRATLRELDRSYTKILADMRADYYVLPAGVVWDNCCDYNTEHPLTYPARQVSPEQYEQIVAAANQNNGSLGIYRTGWGGGGKWSRNVNPALIQMAGIADPKRGWESGDDEAEFWLEDAFPRTYHKYLVVENGDTTTTDWQEVDEDDFWDWEDDLGMAIASKPYGYFESEMNQEAAPPGMNYVGNGRYGEWRQDTSGRSFWHWYGQYAFFNAMFGGNHRYYRSDWDTWNRDYRGRRPYYGSTGGTPAYGTWGSRTGTGRFSRTTFAQRGGFRAQAASVRGAGAASRGRGPGGGGK